MTIWNIYQENAYMSKVGDDATTLFGPMEYDDSAGPVGEELIKRFGAMGPDPAGRITDFPYSISTGPGEIVVKVMFTTDLAGKPGWFTDRWSASPNNITSGDYVVQMRAVKKE